MLQPSQIRLECADRDLARLSSGDEEAIPRRRTCCGFEPDVRQFVRKQMLPLRILLMGGGLRSTILW